MTPYAKRVERLGAELAAKIAQCQFLQAKALDLHNISLCLHHGCFPKTEEIRALLLKLIQDFEQEAKSLEKEALKQEVKAQVEWKTGMRDNRATAKKRKILRSR